MLRDIVLVLSEAIARGDIGVLVDLAEAIWPTGGLVVEERDRVLGLIRVQRVRDRRLDRLVMLRGRTVVHRGREEPAAALAPHCERPGRGPGPWVRPRRSCR